MAFWSSTLSDTLLDSAFFSATSCTSFCNRSNLEKIRLITSSVKTRLPWRTLSNRFSILWASVVICSRPIWSAAPLILCILRKHSFRREKLWDSCPNSNRFDSSSWRFPSTSTTKFRQFSWLNWFIGTPGFLWNPTPLSGYKLCNRSGVQGSKVQSLTKIWTVDLRVLNGEPWTPERLLNYLSTAKFNVLR